jgi:ribosomal protein L11 methyltransferase
MKWRNVTVSATRASLDRLETLLWDAGAVSVTVEDGGESPLFEPGPGETPVWDQVVVTGLFEAEIDTSEVKAVVVANNFTVLVVDDVVDRDWEREWLSRFRPMQFGKRLWVCPTTYEVAEPDAVVLHLDPGLAFGTCSQRTVFE